MITKKEDLINTYIENDFGELRDLYVKKAIELGFAHQGCRDRDFSWYNLEFIGICEGWDNDRLGQTMIKNEKINDYECKKLTLSDLKPRTCTEYEKVTESIFDLRKSLECGELYGRHVESIKATSLGEGYGVTCGYSRITSELELFKLAVNGDAIYRKVEKEIDERQEFVDAACELVDSDCVDFNVNIDCSMAMKSVIVAMAKSGKFKLVGSSGEIE